MSTRGPRIGPNRRLPAYPVYIFSQISFGLLFATFSTISGPYRVVEGDLGPLQLVLVGTVLEASVFLGEIPTGVVADAYSRRLSYIIGIVVVGIGVAIEGLFPNFGTILLAQAVWGIGYTFTSGAHSAWLSDEIGEEAAGHAFLRGQQIGSAAALVGIGLSVGLGSIDLGLPIVLAGVGFVISGIVLAFVMPEAGFKPTARGDRSTFAHLSGTFVAGVREIRGRPVLLAIMAISVVYGLSSEGVDRLQAAHFIDNFTFPDLGRLDPVVWFGVIDAGALLLGIGFTQFIAVRVRHAPPSAVPRLLFAMNVFLAGAMALFGLAFGFTMALGAVWSVYLLRRTIAPLSLIWMNRGLNPATRATVFSMRAQMDSFGQVAGGPLIGLVASVVSLRAGIVTAAVCLLPVAVLYAIALRRPAEPMLPTSAAEAEA